MILVTFVLGSLLILLGSALKIKALLYLGTLSLSAFAGIFVVQVLLPLAIIWMN